MSKLCTECYKLPVRFAGFGGKGLTMEDMEFNKAPRANLDTWDSLKKTITWSSVAIVIVLAIMAATLTG